MKPDRSLTASQQEVLRALRAAKEPLTAYQVLDAVRAHGISAPPTVYRALNRLIEEGHAHRLESINAYVACTDDHEHRHVPAIFAICNNCGQVDELHENALVRRLQANATRNGFHVEAATLELRGRCAACTARA